MRQLNARLTVVVAAVAVAAVAGGGVFAYRQGPQTSTAGASPLGGQPTAPTTGTPSPKPPATPTRTPSATPTAPPATKTGVSGPKTVAVSLAKLRQGRSPQLVHTLDRKVSGGPDQASTVPGKNRIIEATQAGATTYALESRDPDLVLVRSDGAGLSSEVRDVTTLVGAIDGSYAAFATQKQKSTGEQLAGSTVYAENGGELKYKLVLPDAWNVQVIAVADEKVFYAATPKESGLPKLYSWVPGRSSATAVKNVTSPVAVSADGELVVALDVGGAGSCSNIIELATGKKLWRTCDYMVLGFTPDKSFAIAGPAYADGYAAQSSWVLDNKKNGELVREWTGLSFREVRAEDDQHLLMEVDDGPDTKGAIIRCTITSGDCERATPITPGDQFGLGS